MSWIRVIHDLLVHQDLGEWLPLAIMYALILAMIVWLIVTYIPRRRRNPRGFPIK